MLPARVAVSRLKVKCSGEMCVENCPTRLLKKDFWSRDYRTRSGAKANIKLKQDRQRAEDEISPALVRVCEESLTALVY